MTESKKGPKKMTATGRLAGFGAKSLAEVGVSAVPYVGGIVATALTSLEIQHLSDRLEAFVEELREAASRLSIEKLDRDYLQSDEFAAAALALANVGMVIRIVDHGST